MGVVLNNRIYNGVIAQVPFVDVATTMLDDTIPLTTGSMMNGNPMLKVLWLYEVLFSL
jgi:oligopeptidase B